MNNLNDFDVASFMIVNLANEIKNGETVIQGTATFIPLIAAAFAMKEKNFNFIGGFWDNPKINPKYPSTFCLDNYKEGKSFIGLSKFLDMLQTGKIDLEFLRPAQVDKFGNMNNTVIGDYKKPKIRLPGGMGIEDVVRFLKRAILYVPNHNRKIFVEKVDFVTAAGWDKGKGPEKIITNMCIFEFHNQEIVLTAINPLFSIEDIKRETGFEFKIAADIKRMIEVKEKDKRLIEEIDPIGLRNLEIKEKRDEVIENLNKDNLGNV
jgi:glutaconate CoA-transferase subunit B